MKSTSLLSQPIWARRASFALAGLVAATLLTTARADVQVAGTLYVNVDATAATPGLANGIANAGSLGGVFDATNPVPLLSYSNVTCILLTNQWMWLTNAGGGGLIAPAAGMVGVNPHGSIEVWALNSSVAADESMISWGARNTGANVALEYGSGGSGGMSHNGTGNDAGWDFYGGYPAPGLWHHLVYTSDGVRSYLYADGVLVNSYPPTNIPNITNSLSVLLGAQWNNNGTIVSTTPAFATLALARVRVHSGTLSAAQVLNNYNAEKANFPAPPITPAYLSAGPVHRYSFSEAATNDASGLTFHDSVGGADGIVQAGTDTVPPTFTGRRLVLHGDISTSQPGYGYAYGDLPNGLVSNNSTNNGGSGELSIEIWYKNNDGVSWSWSRLFEAGSIGPATPFPASGQEITGPGGFTSGYTFLDSLYITAQDGNSVGARQVGWQNKDYLPGGDNSNTNAGQANTTYYAVGNYQVDRHVVVTWKESTGFIQVFDNGLPAGGCYATNAMSALNDVNVWLGRSLNNDQGFGGEFDEVRLYNYVLSPGQVLGNFQVGPNTVNTSAQAASIQTPPQSQAMNQGWPVTFYVTATGSPGVSYQWNRNNSPIAGATTDTYNIAAVSLANSGDSYTCTVSNNTGTANVQTSSAATLTVVPNVAPPVAVLHETKSANPTVAVGSQRDNYDGTVGCSFTVGSGGAIVSHLGFYDMFGDGLNRDHTVSIYTNGTSTTPLASVVVPAGSDTFITNFYRYVALPNPVFLAPNTIYIVEADTYNGDGDSWADLWQAGAWNPYFVGSNDRFTRQGRYGSHGAAAVNVNGNNNNYGAPNLAVFPVGSPLIMAAQTGVTQYVNFSATLNVAANGEAPMTCQWYKVGSPDAALPGQTGLSLDFASLQASDQGAYYAIVSNHLGTAQSASIYLRVFSDSAVSITQPPTNVTVLQGYSASFYVTAGGTPPIGYQWQRNGSAIPGATTTSYTLAVASSTNNADVFSCIVSNFANGAPHLLPSAGATLTVIPNQAPAPEALIPTVVGTRDNYSGMVGAIFQTGPTPTKVTHLGYYLANGSLNFSHHVDIFSGDGTSIVAEVFVSGSGDVVYNGYAYVALPAPVTLAPNTSYILAAEVFAASNDPWPDVFIPSAWNPYYVGDNPGSTRQARYGGNYPAAPGGNSSVNGIYAAPNMAVLPVGEPIVVDDVTNVTQYATSNVTFTAFVNGQAPVTLQWFKAGSPDHALAGQTSTALTLSNLQLSDAGGYYLAATNAVGDSTVGATINLTVLPASAPTITLQPQSQSVYIHQRATFTVAASVPPQSYQWWFAGNAIANATNSSYTVASTDASVIGDYRATLSNAFGTSTSSVAVLSLLSVPSSSYAANVLSLNPAVYYTFDDLTNSLMGGTSNVVNLGTFGVSNDGTVQGAADAGPGPVPPTYPNFSATNTALVLDGNSVDVAIPALNLDTNNGAHVTLAACVSANGLQLPYAGIIFHRPIGGAVASGLGVTTDSTTGGQQLVYHWANTYYTFATHLQVPSDGTWTFVALVVQPDSATFYLNDGSGMQSVTNVAAHAPVSFAGPSYVGWDDNDVGGGNTTTRRFSGSIDEAMIFDRSLSSSEVGQLYQATAGPVTLTITRSGGSLILTWPAGTLQQSSQATGGFTDVSAATSPYTITPSGTQFFRVRVK